MRLFLIPALLILFLVGCSPQPAPPPTQPTATVPEGAPPVEGYPTPTRDPGSNPYLDPYYSPESAPVTPRREAHQIPDGPAFHVHQPYATDDYVVGSGPAGVPVLLIDVTHEGRTLGETMIQDDGTFRLVHDGMLTPGAHIVLQVGSLDNTPYTPESFRRGPGYEYLPSIGRIVASATVAEADTTAHR